MDLFIGINPSRTKGPYRRCRIIRGQVFQHSNGQILVVLDGDILYVTRVDLQFSIPPTVVIPRPCGPVRRIDRCRTTTTGGVEFITP